MSGKQQASLLLASHPREARSAAVEAGMDSVPSGGTGTKLSLRGRWGEALQVTPRGELDASCVRAAPGKGRSCAQGVRAEGPRALLEDGQVLHAASHYHSSWGQAGLPPWKRSPVGSRTVVGLRHAHRHGGCVGLQGLLEASARGLQRVEHTCAWGRLRLKGPT